MTAWITVPCFNEALRFDPDAFEAFEPDVGLVFVDDGSTDETRAMLEALVARSPRRFELISLPANGGKAAAVRVGVNHALGRGAHIVGYFDADLAAPLSELVGLIDELETSGAEAVIGSRIRTLGRTVERTWIRHVVGRVFATAASITLRMGVYDTQCGAKVFRSDELVRAVFDQPFLSRWAFDVEVLARLRAGAIARGMVPHEVIRERPLSEWRAVPGSRVSVSGGLRAVFDLLRIRRHYP